MLIFLPDSDFILSTRCSLPVWHLPLPYHTAPVVLSSCPLIRRPPSVFSLFSLTDPSSLFQLTDHSACGIHSTFLCLMDLGILSLCSRSHSLQHLLPMLLLANYLCTHNVCYSTSSQPLLCTMPQCTQFLTGTKNKNVGACF